MENGERLRGKIWGRMILCWNGGALWRRSKMRGPERPGDSGAGPDGRMIPERVPRYLRKYA